MICSPTFFWNGHKLKPDPPWSEKLICVKCGTVTSYASFRSTEYGNTIEECQK